MTKQTLLVVPAGSSRIGLTAVSLGLVRALQRLQVRVGFFKPISQPRPGYTGPERSTALVQLATGTIPPEPISRDHAESVLVGDGEQRLLELIVERYQEAARHADVVVVEGLAPLDEVLYPATLNADMIKALDAHVVIAGAVDERGPEETAEAIEIAARAMSVDDEALLGCVLNKVPVALDRIGHESLAEARVAGVPEAVGAPYRAALDRRGLPCLGLVPFSPLLARPRIKEVAEALGAGILRRGQQERRVHGVAVLAMTAPNAVARGMKPGNLVIVPGDRLDLLMAAALATLDGLRLAGVLLCGGLMPDERIFALCEPALKTGLPVLQVYTDTLETAASVMGMDEGIATDDRERAELVMNTVADGLDPEPLDRLLHSERERHLSPPAFRHMLMERAREADKRIVLPEGDEPRTVTAASICAARGIARCVLLGDPERVQRVARQLDVSLDGVEVLDPGELVARYVPRLVELRGHKGVHELVAKDLLQDHVYLGTMMLEAGHVDGLVSGAVHTTASTIRPALQVIKTAPGYSLVSSIFFMCLPDQVLVYGDCAVNPDPTADELADIAVQCAESAEAFGVTPRVAMISYATGTSTEGTEVEKVAQATRLAQERRPDLLVDGPLQYDAASVQSVGASKAPDSPVAGRATVFVFPDLNTGNTTYKAVQRSAKVISMGPMLQGLAKPVNDLSRGALVDDIVFTIALTAIQATQD